MATIDKKTLDGIYGRLSIIEEKIAVQDGEITELDLTSLAIWMPEAFHEPGVIGGIVVDEGKARESECRYIPLGETGRLVYSKGVVGALSQDQERLYCDSISEMPVSPAMALRTRLMRDAAVICQQETNHLPEGERLEPFMQCLAREAKKSGIKI